MKKQVLTALAMSVAVQTHAASQEMIWGEANQLLPQFKTESPFSPKGLLNTIVTHPTDGLQAKVEFQVDLLGRLTRLNSPDFLMPGGAPGLFFEKEGIV